MKTKKITQKTLGRTKMKSSLPLDKSVTNDEIRNLCALLAPKIDSCLPDGYGFVFIVAPCSTKGGDGFMNWVTSCNVEDSAVMLKELLGNLGFTGVSEVNPQN